MKLNLVQKFNEPVIFMFHVLWTRETVPRSIILTQKQHPYKGKSENKARAL